MALPIMEIISGLIVGIPSIAITASKLASKYGHIIAVAKAKISIAVKAASSFAEVLDEAEDVLTVVDKALVDKKLTPDEIKHIAKEVRELYYAGKNFARNINDLRDTD